MKAKDIKYVFEQNPELSKVGNSIQYYKYLKTIFPESKVKDLVHHGSKKENLDNFNTISNWTPKGNSKFKIKQETSKGLYLTKDKNYIEKFRKDNIVNQIYSLLVNIKSPKFKGGIVNSNDIEIGKVKKLEERGYDSIISDEGGDKNTIIAFDSAQIHILGSKKDLEGFKQFTQNTSKDSLEKRVVSGIFVFAFLYGLISSTSIITGNVIGVFETKLNLISPALIALGLGGFLFLRKYKK